MLEVETDWEEVVEVDAVSGPVVEVATAVVDEEACFGCLMCKHICPVDGCISYKVVAHHGPMLS